MSEELSVSKVQPTWPAAKALEQAAEDVQLPPPSATLMLLAVLLFAGLAITTRRRREQLVEAIDVAFSVFVGWSKVVRLRGARAGPEVARSLGEAHAWWREMRPFFKAASLERSRA